MPAAVWRRLLDDLAAVILPIRCLGCERWLLGSRARPRLAVGDGCEQAPAFDEAMRGYFCAHCREQWTPVTPPLCPRCGLVFKSRAGDNHLCGRCLHRPGHVQRARAAGIYDRSLRVAIHAMKFGGQVTLARPLGALLWQAYRHNWPSGDIDVVAPVPLHRRRLRQRGFNQAYLLVISWNLPGETVVVRDALVRHRATPPQTGLDRRQRRINIKNAFVVRRADAIHGKRVLLVDDVLTTGATVQACAAALTDAGAARVDALTLARAL